MASDSRSEVLKFSLNLVRIDPFQCFPSVEQWAREILHCITGEPTNTETHDLEEFDEFCGYMGPGDIAEDRSKGVKYVIGEALARLVVLFWQEIMRY